ncbi:hypothetical protein [Clostridium sp. LP20]|uniref:hypothetical protein n=1 Tax=Clostridium sp. LP20 TaxID=3418665 RepID=UPI003EE74EF8
MGNNQIRAIKAVLIKHGEKVLSRVMTETENDIKVNRIAFGIKTSKQDFMRLFYMNLNVYLKSC